MIPEWNPRHRMGNRDKEFEYENEYEYAYENDRYENTALSARCARVSRPRTFARPTGLHLSSHAFQIAEPGGLFIPPDHLARRFTARPT
jgi:hypothetical protein